MTKPKHAASGSLTDLDQQIAALEELKKKRMAERQVLFGSMITQRAILDLTDRQWGGILAYLSREIGKNPDVISQWEGRGSPGAARGRAGGAGANGSPAAAPGGTANQT